MNVNIDIKEGITLDNLKYNTLYVNLYVSKVSLRCFINYSSRLFLASYIMSMIREK